jgi:hypothetical protein
VPVLRALAADAVIAAVDVSGRGPGTYTVDVAVRAPPGVTAASLQPPRVAVTIKSTRPSPSP